MNATMKKLLITVIVFLMSACDEDNSSKTDDQDTDVDTDSTSDTDSNVNEQTYGCVQFHDYAVGCEITGTTLIYLDAACSVIDSIFIDSILLDSLNCFSPDDCEEFKALLAEDSTGEENSFTQCFENNLSSAEPDAANNTFREHFCDYIVGCDETITIAECNLYFTDPEEMMLFNALDAPYITNADACVYPKPECIDYLEVEECLTSVIDEISASLEILEL